MSSTGFWVGDRVVRPSLGEINLGLERVHVEPRSMEVLVALARRAPEVVPKRELIEAVWGEAFVSDEVLTHAVWDLRRAFGDRASDPEFIQTIPKKGYRLIAPVKALAEVDGGEEGGGALRPLFSARGLASGATLAAFVAAGLTLVLRAETPGPPPPGSTALVLVATDPPPGREDWGLRLDRGLRRGLTGIDGIELRRAARCEPAADVERTYCLEPALFSITDACQLSVDLRAADTAEELYTTPVAEVTVGKELDAAAAEHSKRITAYIHVTGNRFFDDPDIRPWISLQRHDPRAIEDFLLGVEYTYRDEIGARDPMRTAIDKDPNFVAPWVWRTPAIIDEAAGGVLAPEALAEHRAELERLYDDATPFEKAMISWAVALVDGDRPVAIRQLRVALREEPGNRPALMVLGSLLMVEGSYEGAWQAFAPLLEQRWVHPGLYDLAAQSALCLGKIEEMRAALDLAQLSKPVDPAVFEMLRLLAIHDGDAERERRYHKRLERRRRQMLPELVAIEIDCVDWLAASAETGGRRAIVARPRHSAD